MVTAGGTREPIDAVRFVGNRSSGRMGFALAEEAQRRGATVTVVAANVSIPRAPGIEYVDVGTAAELADACAARFDACDVLLMAAAVADYRPAEARDGKIKKDQTGEELNLSLVRTTDVLSSLAERRRAGQLIVGFAAEHGDGALAYGRDKLARKNLDAIVVNDIGGAGIGFESTDNEVMDRHGRRRAARAEGVQGADRGGDPRRRLEPPFITRHKGSTLNGTLGGGRPGAARAGRDRQLPLRSPGASPRTSAAPSR